MNEISLLFKGDNLMDVANSLVNEGVNVFGKKMENFANRKLGLCDKQLACTTCSVHVLKNYEKLKPPSEEELDILFTLPEYHYK